MAKTITVTDEMYDFLMQLSKEINTQDNRSTKMPYFFQIEDEEEILQPDGFGDPIWVLNSDHEYTLETEDEIKEKVFEIKYWDLENKDHKEHYDELCYFEIDDIL